MERDLIGDFEIAACAGQKGSTRAESGYASWLLTLALKPQIFQSLMALSAGLPVTQEWGQSIFMTPFWPEPC
jgi:hypothetical protein